MNKIQSLTIPSNNDPSSGDNLSSRSNDVEITSSAGDDILSYDANERIDEDPPTCSSKGEEEEIEIQMTREEIIEGLKDKDCDYRYVDDFKTLNNSTLRPPVPEKYVKRANVKKLKKSV